MRSVRLASIFLVLPAALTLNLFGQVVGQGLFSKVAGSYTAEYLPKVDVRQFFSTPYPTSTQAQSDDFGAVLNSALVFAGPQGACVDLSGIAGYQLYANSNPYSGLAPGSGPCIVGGPATVTTSAMISTPSGDLMVDAVPNAAAPTAQGLLFQPCNALAGCGPRPLFRVPIGDDLC
jgi:hypothetical protein